MRVFTDDLTVQGGRRHAAGGDPAPHARDDYKSGEVVVAALWLAFYSLALAAAVTAPVVSRVIDLAVRW